MSLTSGINNFGTLHNATRTGGVLPAAKHLVSGLFVVYVFAMIEEYINPAGNEWNQFLTGMSAEDKEKLMAYKHIRHSAAHRIDGERATTHKNTFDSVQSRTTISETIQGANVIGNKLELDDNVGFQFFLFVQKLVDEALPRELNP